jgi:hypothetical protein
MVGIPGTLARRADPRFRPCMRQVALDLVESPRRPGPVALPAWPHSFCGGWHGMSHVCQAPAAGAPPGFSAGAVARMPARRVSLPLALLPPAPSDGRGRRPAQPPGRRPLSSCTRMRGIMLAGCCPLGEPHSHHARARDAVPMRALTECTWASSPARERRRGGGREWKPALALPLCHPRMWVGLAPRAAAPSPAWQGLDRASSRAGRLPGALRPGAGAGRRPGG